MKKIILLMQCALLGLCVSSCEKDPYPAADIDFEPVYRVMGREFNNTSGIQIQTTAQKAIFTLDAIYDLYIYYDRETPMITTFSNKNYVECTIEEIYNYQNSGVEGEYYHVTFSRKVPYTDEEGAECEADIYYEIKYYVDRTIHQRYATDEDGNPVGDENGDYTLEDYYLDNYIIVTTADGEEIGGNDNIDLLEQERAF